VTTQQERVAARQETLDWVHRELATIKNAMGLLQQRMDQAAGLAVDSADKTDQLRLRVDRLEIQVKAIEVLQEDLRTTRDQVDKLHDALGGLRQLAEELSRHRQEDVDRLGEERNQTVHRFADQERLLETWREKIIGFEEQHRRGVEAAAQLALKIEALENESGAQAVRHSRLRNSVGRMDQEVSRLSSALEGLIQEDEVFKERLHGANEFLRRLESEADSLRSQINRIDRIDDRLELVQAERSRHGERLMELTSGLDAVNSGQYEQDERSSLLEARLANFQTDLRGLDDKLDAFREQLAVYLRAVNQSEGDFRKRGIAALEKEVREIRGRAIDFAEE
jgi:chromosome segregation ATPase